MNNEALKKLEPIFVRNNDGKWNGKTVITGAYRGTFVYVHEKHTSERFDREEYCTTLLIPKDDPFAEKIQKAADAVYFAKFKKKRPALSRIPLVDGDEKADKYPEMAGHWLLKAGDTRNQPLAINASKEIEENPREFYSGAYYRIKFDLFAYDKGTPGVAAALMFVQKLADAEPLGGSAPERLENIPDLPEELQATPTSGIDEDLGF